MSGRIQGSFAVLDNSGTNRFEWRERVIPNVDHESSDEEIRYQADVAAPAWKSHEEEVWLLGAWDHAPPCCHANIAEAPLHACTICLCDCYRPEPPVGMSPPCHECGRHFFHNHKPDCSLFGKAMHAPNGA